MASSDGWVAAYRIVSPRWADSAFSGEGARKYGGRWNSPGRRMVYLAGSRALAALEMLVHLTTPGSRAKPYRIIEARIPVDLIIVGDAAPTATAHTVALGDEWLASGRSAAWRTPSVLIPEEPNFLINPDHPDAPKIRIGESTDFRFDRRL